MNSNTNTNPNSYSLTADSRRWWWPSATAGVAGTAAIAAILILPTTGHAMPTETVRNEAPATVFGSHSFAFTYAPADRPCFMTRAHWNVALDGAQPVCSRTAKPAPPERSGVIRPWLDY